MKLVKVIWEDAGDMDEGPWVYKAEAKPTEAIIFFQVGWLFEHTAEAVVLTPCMGEHQMGVRSRIPIGMVRKMIELTDGADIPIQLKKVRTKKSPQ